MIDYDHTNHKNSGCRLAEITPTPFFIEQGDTLQQRVEIVLENQGSPEEMELTVRGPQVVKRFSLGTAASGISVHFVYLPDFRQETHLEFLLHTGSGNLAEQIKKLWQPTRHWMVYVNPSSHHDLGYTDLPSNVLREHDTFLDDVVRFCEETSDWPPESRFHYTIEQAWSVLHYLAHRPPDQAQRLVSQIHAGQIEVTALFGNETSELCSHEEQIRLLYPAFRMQRRLGIPIRTAELNDVPGISWGLASVLVGAGVRYFAPGIPDYFAWGMRKPFIWDEQAVLARNLPGAFWWEGPDGQKVLFWYEGGGLHWSGIWSVEQMERELRGCLERLESQGYPHDLLRSRVQGGNRDNSPPDMRFSRIVRDWNERWAYPRLILSTNTQFFEAYEAAAGGSLKTLRGDIPGTDYPIGATSTPAATAVNRNAHDTFASAENLAACASLVAGMPYPSAQLAEVCDQMLLFDEHTWGMAHPTGPAQDACWSQKAQFAYRAAALAHDVLSKSANLLADQVSLSEEGYAVVVYNTLACERTAPVIVEGVPTSPSGKPMHWHTGRDGEPPVLNWGNAIGRHLFSLPAVLLDAPFDLVDLSNGQAVPHQIVTLDDPLSAAPHAAHRYALGLTDSNSVDLLNYDLSQRKELIFVAQDVPSLGYKTYAIRPASIPNYQTRAQPELSWGDTWLENRYYHIELDPISGAVSSIYDKELHQELVDPHAPHRFFKVVARNPRTGQASTPSRSIVLPGISGPVCASLVVSGDAPGCPLRKQEIRLCAGLKRIDFAVRLLRDSTPLLELFLAFPFQVQNPHWQYEASNAVQTPIADQLPGSNTNAYAVQHWVRIANPEVTITWTSLDAPVAAFGKLWSSPVSQAHHGATPPEFGAPYLRDPALMEPGHLYSYLSVNNFRTNFQPAQAGDLLFRFSVTSLPGGHPISDVTDFGWSASVPLAVATVRGPGTGRLPVSTSFCRVNPPNVQMWMKAAENGDGLILRLHESTGQSARVNIDLSLFEVEEAWITDLVERDQSLIPRQGNSIQVEIAANASLTIRCRGAKAKFPPVQDWWFD